MIIESQIIEKKVKQTYNEKPTENSSFIIRWNSSLEVYGTWSLMNDGKRFSTVHMGIQSSDLISFLQPNDNDGKSKSRELNKLLHRLWSFQWAIWHSYRILRTVWRFKIINRLTLEQYDTSLQALHTNFPRFLQVVDCSVICTLAHGVISRCGLLLWFFFLFSSKILW